MRRSQAAYDVRVRSHEASERSSGVRGESLFALREPGSERTSVHSRLYLPTLPTIRQEQRLADGQAW